MALDEYVTLGRSGLRVSPLCLGTMTFGEDWGWGASVKESEAILDRFLDRGGNFLDTANVYTRGHSEKIIGDHVCKSPSKRDRVVIATKFTGNLFRGDPNGGGAGRKAIYAACEASMRRLRTDYIDLYWMHVWDRWTPVEETLRALEDLVASGKARYLGFSDTPAWKVAQAQTMAQLRGWAPLVALQIEYSLLERTVEGELVPMAQELGLGITPWSPLKGGILSGKYTRSEAVKGANQPARGEWVSRHLHEQSFKVVDELGRIAKELGSTPARVALAWVQGRPGVGSTILGVRTVAQLDDNLAALDVRLTDSQLAALDSVSRPSLNFPADFLGMAPTFTHGGASVNGVAAPAWEMAPKDDRDRY